MCAYRLYNIHQTPAASGCNFGGSSDYIFRRPNGLNVSKSHGPMVEWSMDDPSDICVSFAAQIELPRRYALLVVSSRFIFLLLYCPLLLPEER